MTWLWRLELAGVLLALFYAGIFLRLLRSDYGSRWIHHSLFVVLVAFPVELFPHLWLWRIWFLLNLCIGIGFYVDDVLYHLFLLRLGLRSPVHDCGDAIGLNNLKYRLYMWTDWRIFT